MRTILFILLFLLHFSCIDSMEHTESGNFNDLVDSENEKKDQQKISKDTLEKRLQSALQKKSSLDKLKKPISGTPDKSNKLLQINESYPMECKRIAAQLFKNICELAPFYKENQSSFSILEESLKAYQEIAKTAEIEKEQKNKIAQAYIQSLQSILKQKIYGAFELNNTIEEDCRKSLSILMLLKELATENSDLDNNINNLENELILLHDIESGIATLNQTQYPDNRNKIVDNLKKLYLINENEINDNNRVREESLLQVEKICTTQKKLSYQKGHRKKQVKNLSN